jgi:LPS sulfotransferase NodH
MKRQTSVRRFMLLATARSGSNLLSSLLAAHPSIRMHGELFNLDMLPTSSLVEALEDPIAYLREKLAREPRSDTAAVGFKMFYSHLTDEYFDRPGDLSGLSERAQRRTRQFVEFVDSRVDRPALQQRCKAAWDALIADRSLQIIHLRRPNLLHTLISLKMAFKTDQWWSLKDGAREVTTVCLTPDECQRYFQQVDAAASRADAAFAHHEGLSVTYDELTEARDDVLARIFAFLDVPNMPVSTILKKQLHAPPRDLVEGYGQLRDYFRDTRWHFFFE